MAREEITFLYIITDKDSVNFKVGLAKNPLARIKELSTGNSNRLYLVASFSVGNPTNALKVEQLIHRQIGKNRRRHGEWFELSPFDLKALISLVVDSISLDGVPIQFNNDIKKINKETDEQIVIKAKELVLLQKKASTSFLQRKLSIGYARASRIMDKLEQMGIVSTPTSTGGRFVSEQPFYFKKNS